MCWLLAIHEGGGVKGKVQPAVENVEPGDEEDDDGGDLAPQLLLRYEDGEGDDIHHTAHHSHCTQRRRSSSGEIHFSRLLRRLKESSSVGSKMICS